MICLTPGVTSVGHGFAKSYAWSVEPFKSCRRPSSVRVFRVMFRLLFLVLFFSLVCVGVPIYATESVSSLAAPKEKSFVDWVLEGVEAERKKDYPRALQAYSEALSLEPESVVARVRRIVCAARVGDRALMIADLQKALELQPVSMSDYLSLAWLRATSPIPEVRDPSLAIAYAQKAMSTEKSIEAFDCLAAAYAQRGDFDRARLEMERALKLFPKHSRVEAMRERLELYRQRKTFLEDWSPTVVPKSR